MACSAVRSPILRNSAVRNYAAAAKACQSSSTSPAAPEVQVLPNKITVAALDNNSPLSQVSIVFKAGSRNETYDTQGVSNFLRLAAGLTTKRATTFGITRNIQQLGGNLYATTDRESISYTLQVTRNNLQKALSFLEDVATRQAFKPWELSDSKPRLEYELATRSESVRVIESLHRAAYRTGLGFSLYTPKRQIDNISSETLQHFVNSWCTSERCCVVGTGVSMSELSAYAQNLQVPGAGGQSTPGKYYGGEIRKDRNSEIATVSLAVESSGFEKENEALAFAVLQNAAGAGPHVKWGNSIAPLHRGVASAAGSMPFAVSAFNASYSDTGLFGFVLSAPAAVAGSLTKAAYKWMTSPNITDIDVARAKAELKSAILFSTENGAGQLENMSQQVLFRGRITTPTALAAEVEKISAADVKKAAGKLNGKVSMSSIGNLETVPHIDQLKS